MHQVVRACVLPVMRFAARSYIAGPESADAIRVSRLLAKRNLGSTICYWNDKADAPRTVADQYLKSLVAMAEENLDWELSVKAPALQDSENLIEEVAEQAEKARIRLHFDSHGPESVEATFDLIDAAGPNKSGCTLPGRWRRSLTDADRAIDLGLHVRVVKGEWPDQNHLSTDPRDGFLRVIDRLVGRARKVSVATHDAALAREALQRLRAGRTPCEQQLLFGLPADDAMHVGREMGVPIRFYVPYGWGWLPYSVSKAYSNPHIILRLLRDLLKNSSGDVRNVAGAGSG